MHSNNPSANDPTKSPAAVSTASSPAVALQADLHQVIEATRQALLTRAGTVSTGSVSWSGTPRTEFFANMKAVCDRDQEKLPKELTAANYYKQLTGQEPNYPRELEMLAIPGAIILRSFHTDHYELVKKLSLDKTPIDGGSATSMYFNTSEMRPQLLTNLAALFQGTPQTFDESPPVERAVIANLGYYLFHSPGRNIRSIVPSKPVSEILEAATSAIGVKSWRFMVSGVVLGSAPEASSQPKIEQLKAALENTESRLAVRQRLDWMKLAPTACVQLHKSIANMRTEVSKLPPLPKIDDPAWSAWWIGALATSKRFMLPEIRPAF